MHPLLVILYVYLDPTDVATRPTLYTTPIATGIQDLSAGVSPETSVGCEAHDADDVKTITRN